MAHEEKRNFELDPNVEGWPDYWNNIPAGRLKLIKVSVRPIGEGKQWVELTYVRPWHMRAWLTVRGWFIAP